MLYELLRALFSPLRYLLRILGLWRPSPLQQLVDGMDKTSDVRSAVDEANRRKEEKRRKMEEWPFSAEEIAAANAAIGQLYFEPMELPRDAEGFVQSFELSQLEEIVEFYEKYGFVIVNNILSKEEIEASVEEIWTELETGVHGMSKVDRNDTLTWADGSWPRFVISQGLLGGDISKGAIAFQNRQNAKLYNVFKTLYGQEDLWVSIDRYGAMRPTKSVPVGKLKPVKLRVEVSEPADGVEVKDLPSWKTKPLWLHWDLNPWKWTGSQEGLDYKYDHFIIENNGARNQTGKDKKMQGILALVDSRVQDGGFCCVPGFHRCVALWAKATTASDWAHKFNFRYDFVPVPPEDKMNEQVQKISMRAGSLVVWSSELPHCNYPNDSERFRFNQYVKMFPAPPAGSQDLDKREIDMKVALRYAAQQGFKITTLGEKLFGVLPW